jgi:predicted PurR-regulated permease PerM
MDTRVIAPSNFYQIVKWASIVIIIAGIKLSTPIILPLFIALFLSITLSFPINFLVTKRVPRTLATIIILLSFGGLVYLIGDIIGKNSSEFFNNLPQYQKILSDKLAGTQVGDFINDTVAGEQDKNKILGFVLNTLSAVQRVVGKIVFIALLTVFMTFELDVFPIKFRAIFGRKGEKGASANIRLIANNITRYLGIKTVTSFLTALFIYIALKIIGVDYAILWAMLAFLFNYIPNIGSMLAAIPALLFTWIQLGNTAFLFAGLTYLFVNMIIGSIIEPKILGKGMGLSTFIVFLSLVFWGWIMGPVGMFLSVPLTMTLKIILNSNQSSKYFAILLGTRADAIAVIREDR